MQNVRAHLKISGMVQGVFFRDSTRREAQALNVSGWVRNCPDGSVEVIAEGEKTAVDQLVDWCRSGPIYARVDHVLLDWEEYRGEGGGFLIRR
ncbi:MAG: acylphosphatase [Candidatus Schekmanbacteria bacterium]|nr:acylphosphatase [Candidatus Schekmanbacteria bacterium]